MKVALQTVDQENTIILSPQSTIDAAYVTQMTQQVAKGNYDVELVAEGSDLRLTTRPR